MTDFLVDRYITQVLDRCAIAVLRDWENMESKLDPTGEAWKAMENMTNLHGWLSDSPVQSSGNRQEDKLISNIERLIVAEQGARDAKRYFQAVLPVWDKLTDEERYLLSERFIRGGNGIQRIMGRMNVEKTKAYDLTNGALTRFRKMLFW